MFAQILWNSPRSLPVALAIALAALAAVVWLYPPQVRGLSWRWRWGLPALRVAGLVTLAAALLKPAVLRPKTRDEQGTVVVLVDRSRSMAVADNARTPAQLVALAAGMGRLPGGLRPDVAVDLAARAAEVRPRITAVERAWGDLDYARVAGRGVEAARERVETVTRALRESTATFASARESLTDATLRERLGALTEVPPVDAADVPAKLASLRSGLEAAIGAVSQAQAAADEQLYQSNPQVKAACDELAVRSRLSLAEDALVRPETGLLARLGADATVVGYGVSDDLSPFPLSQPRGATATQPSTYPATTASTLPAASVGAIAADGRRSDITGAVRKALDLFENRDLAAVVLFSDGRQSGAEGAVTAGLAASGVPVFAVATSPPGAVRDVAVGAVTTPTSALAGETATVRVEVRPQGVRDGEVAVKLSPEGTAEQVQTVKFADGRPAAVEFQLKLERVGAQRLDVSLSGIAGEATTENNAARRWVKVLSQKVKVGAFAALPGWDFQYLRNSLVRTPWVELQAGVLSPEAPRLPLLADQILQQDVLVLADVPVAALDDGQWGAAFRLVSERGGSVVLIAGPAHVPAEYGPHFVASLLLPYPLEIAPTWRMWPGEEPMFRLVPDQDAAGESFLRIGTGGSRLSALQRWQMLPGFYRVMPVGRLKPNAQALLVEASSGEAVLTQMRVGSGRTFLFGADETWRWRSSSGDDVHDRFWLQLIRYAAGEPYAAKSERMALDVDRIAIDAGEDVVARVRTFGGGGAETFRLNVMKDGQVFRTLSATRAGSAESGRYRARVGALPTGDYEVRLSEAAGEAAGLSLPLHVTAGYETELADVSGDESVLARLAESSGGGLYRLEQMGQLAERLRATTDRRARFVEQRLWDSPYLFVLIVAFFAAEWAARKRLGLA